MLDHFPPVQSLPSIIYERCYNSYATAFMYVLLLYEANFIYLIMVSAPYVLGTIIFCTYPVIGTLIAAISRKF